MTTQILFYPVILYNKLTILRFPRINRKAALILSFSLIVLLSALYVFQINDLMAGSFFIKTSLKKIDSISKENKILEIQSAQIGFLGNIEGKAKELNFEKVGKIKYIQALEGSLATKAKPL
jgi:hypothetical protein